MDREAQHHMFGAALETAIADEPVNEVVNVELSEGADGNWLITVKRAPLPKSTE